MPCRFPGPHPRGKLRGIRSRPTAKGEVGGIQSRPTAKGEVEGDQPGGGPAPVGDCLLQGVPAPGGGCLLPGAPHTDGYCCGRYASYWNAFLLSVTSVTISKTLYL